MGKRSSAAMVDARDMTCAQALAQASLAIRRLDVGAVLEIICNAPDVKQDLLIWAKALGHEVLETEDGAEELRVWVRKGR